MVTKAPINKEENDMTLKKFGALLLAGAMMTGTIGVMSPTQAKAATPANTYTMTVPADMDIQNSGWNPLGNIKITGSIDDAKTVTVTATTAHNFALTSEADESVSYTLKKAETDTAATTSFKFDAASINAEGRASQTIGVDVEDFAEKPAGNYTDTITFTGKMSEVLAWSENDLLRVDFEVNNHEYTLGFVLYELKSGTIKYQKDWEEDEAPKHEEKEATLQISGNVFTFTCEDVNFTLDFSNKTYSIQGDSSCKFTHIAHVESSTGTLNEWLGTLRP